MIGDTTLAPTLPKPKKKKCNAVASVVMVVVAVVVTVFTAGAGAALVASAASSLSVAGAAVAAAANVIGLGIGAALGSLASQAVGKAMGVVDHISWKQAAVSGLATSFAAAAAPVVGAVGSAVGSATAGYVAQGVVSYTASYIASKVVGLDSSFSWRNMAASAVGAAVAGNVYGGNGITASIVRGQVSAHASAWMNDKWFGGGRPDYGQVAADAFGNALADYIVGEFNNQAQDKRRTQDEPERTIDKPILNKGGNPFYSADDSEGHSSGQVLLASNGNAVPITRSDVVDVVDPGLVAEFREAGWFNVLSSLAEDESSGFKYAASSRSDLGSRDDVQNIPKIDQVTGGVILPVSSPRSLGERLKELYNDTAFLPYLPPNGNVGHDSIAQTINIGSGVASSGRLLYGAVDELLIWAGFGGIDRLPPVASGPIMMLKADVVVTKNAFPVVKDSNILAAGVPYAFDAIERLVSRFSKIKVFEGANPYYIRIDPITGKGPMGIDTSLFSDGVQTVAGGLRDHKRFWRAWLSKYPETLSEANFVEILKRNKAPLVDETWIKYFPEHAAFEGGTLVHHHLDYGRMAIPLPKNLHSSNPGWAVWHIDHGGK